MNGYTDYLYARPSLLEGIGRNMDLFGALNVYNVSTRPEQADIRAFLADRLALDADFEKARRQVLCELTE